MDSGKLNCPYRLNPRRTEDDEIATCGLIQQLLQVRQHGIGDVSRQACQACVGSTPVASSFINSVFPSILHEACEEYLERESRCETQQTQRAREMLRITEQAIVNDLEAAHRVATCDVFICCTDSSTATRRSIQSILNQQNAIVNVHLIIDDFNAEALADEYSTTWNVQVHHSGKPSGLFRSVHALAPLARSEFIALQHSGAVSLPNRIANAIGELWRTGSDLVGSGLLTPSGERVATEPSEAFEPAVPWPTLVFRRSTFIDLGGFADRQGDQDVEWVYRARLSGAKIRLMPIASVQLTTDGAVSKNGPKPNYVNRFGSLRHHAIGYPQSAVNCDVVIPVYGQLEYVRQAIESIVCQEGAEAIVHLIDDSGPENVDNLFRYWGSHPRVRLYRNTRNVGQYVSFNNVSDFFETDLVAVQDGDDISLPHRLHTSGNLLRLCDAEFFAATMEQFGEEDLIKGTSRENRLRRSFQPYGNHNLYFAMNPTACFRVSMFRRLGGYSDFGGREHNRGGLDSELMIRASFSGARFALSSSVVSRHRIHQQAATRSAETGFGSATRQLAISECHRRVALFRKATFDPRSFGALGRYRNVTQRVG